MTTTPLHGYLPAKRIRTLRLLCMVAMVLPSCTGALDNQQNTPLMANNETIYIKNSINSSSCSLSIQLGRFTCSHPVTSNGRLRASFAIFPRYLDAIRILERRLKKFVLKNHVFVHIEYSAGAKKPALIVPLEAKTTVMRRGSWC